MVKTSTLFFIINSINYKNALYLPDELLDPCDVDDKIVREYLDGFKYEPGENALDKVLQAAKL